MAKFSTIQGEFVLVFLAGPLNIFLLLCLDKVSCSVRYCTARPMKVIFSNFYSQVYLNGLNNTVKYFLCS